MPKSRVNLTVDSTLLDEAKSAGLRLSETFEAALSEALRREAGEAWRRENAGAIEDYNQRIGLKGPFGRSLRRY